MYVARVTCDSSGRVSALLAPVNRATSSSIPTELSRATHLESLELDNNFVGTLPQSICKLLRLKSKSIDGTAVGGAIPDCWFGLPRLVSLAIRESLLNGALNSAVGAANGLQTLDLTGNQMTGTLPNEMRFLQNLSEISLKGNAFSGSASILG